MIDEIVLMMLWRCCCLDDGVIDDVVYMVLCGWFEPYRNALQNAIEMLPVLRMQCKTNRDAQSAAPATQNEPEVLQALQLPRKNEPEVLRVLRLQRKTSLRCSERCACDAKRGGAQKHLSSPDFRCTCHAKRA